MSAEPVAGGADFLVLRDLEKRFDDHRAVDQVSLGIRQGEIVALLGPSGSGKTTTLRLLAGFERPERGTLSVAGEDITNTPPVARRFGMVFQHYALFPHLDVGGNIAFGLESLGVTGSELIRRVATALELVELGGFERRRISQLSGGQQQRVALARALAPEPRVLLLDEPLSNLDPSLRERTRRELRALIQRVGTTTVLVTHEQEEAFDLADRVAVLNQGRLEQVGTPDELYAVPRTPFVARFVGRTNEMRATLVAVEGDRCRVRLAGVEWSLPTNAAVAPGPVQVLARPEALGMVAPGPDRLTGKVLARRFTGAQGFFTVALGDGTTIEVAADPWAVRVGDRVGLEPKDRGVHLFPHEPA